MDFERSEAAVTSESLEDAEFEASDLLTDVVDGSRLSVEDQSYRLLLQAVLLGRVDVCANRVTGPAGQWNDEDGISENLHDHRGSRLESVLEIVLDGAPDRDDIAPRVSIHHSDLH